MTEPTVQKSEFGALIDGTAESFKEHCANKDLGYVKGLKNYIVGAYQTLVKMKEDLIAKVRESSLPEDSEEMKTVRGIYTELMKLEEKSCLCTDIIKERELKD